MRQGATYKSAAYHRLVMRTARVIACVPLLLAGCGESIQSSPTAASSNAAPRTVTPLVVDSETTRNSGLSPKQWQTLYDEIHKALSALPLPPPSLPLPHDPWAAPLGLDIPGPNYDRWDLRPDRDSRGRPARGW